ncbi:RING finger protein [Endozoicomonas sp. 8E]|uniref:RING finger protein n=1 Tax=Endozoicomonas sp. 8E TaxID=3035692 RepID=UPI0029395482|nr:RING finger protein [Endozoicomonas sp. 8E]WOG29209.1 RING finger protein [Endozoicomonas sp. 8E]
MVIPCDLKTFLFSVFLFFYQQGLANDTYGLEEFCQYQKTNWKPSPEKQQNYTAQPAMDPLEDIRVGFLRLNLASDDLSGDERLEICEKYEVAEQDFRNLINLYFDYVNMGDPQYRKVRIQKMLRLIKRIFAINTNITNGKSRAERKLIEIAAKSLFEQMFLSPNINGSSNPYFNYFDSTPESHRPYNFGVNNGLVLMLLAFLGPHFLSMEQLNTNFGVLNKKYTGKSYVRAFNRGLLSRNIDEYNSPQGIANQLNRAELDAGTALLIGLSAMASSTYQYMCTQLESRDTLETVLISYLLPGLLPIVYRNITRHCLPPSRLLPRVMLTVSGIQEFTQSILGIDLTPASSSESLSNLRFLHYLSFYSEDSDSEDSIEESDSEYQDQSIVIQQQNELIAELRRESARQPAREEAGAVGGALVETKKCPICRNPVEDTMLLASCGHAGFCKDCAERIIDEQRGCPFCRERPSSYIRVIDMSFP